MSASELNETNKITKELMEDQLPPLRNLKPNNNRYLVTFGIIIVLFTLYITPAAISHKKIATDPDMMDKEEQILIVNLREKENQRQALILEKLREHEHICSELEIFIKEFKWNEKHSKENPHENSKSNSIEVIVEGNDDEINTNSSDEKDKSHHSIEVEKIKKQLNGNKKDQEKKKNSTAEPIIYLFALVFIYLLLKAASDINQHYKSQAKGDKRLRRCSLQSYAQTHKQDRRASKDKPLSAINQRHNFLDQRSQSFERPRQQRITNSTYKYDLINSQQSGIGYRYLRTDLSISDPNVSPNRRCSVPALLNSQKHKIIPGTRCSDTSRRRSSIIHGSNTGTNSLSGSFENFDSQFSENKRRVRMINRH